MMDRNQQTFLDEATELLADLEGALLAIENDPNNMELVGRIFRAMHTIKGSSALFGFEAIASFTHRLETAFDLVREGKVSVTHELVTLTLSSRDQISSLLELAVNGEKADEALTEKGAEILRKLEALVPAAAEADAVPATPGEIGPRIETRNQKPALYRIHFKPPENIFLRGLDPLNLFRELAEMGDEQHLDHSEQVSGPAPKEDELCHSVYDILLLTAQSVDAIRDVFIFVEEDNNLQIEKLHDETPFGKEEWQPLIDTLRTSMDIPSSSLKSLIKEIAQSRGEVKNDAGPVGTVGNQPNHRGIQSVKVPAERLDKLVNLVGELVTVQARLTISAATLADPGLTQIAEEVEALIAELRDNAMSIRMVPIGATFARFRRLVRDLSLELGKEIQLVAEGEDTEVDKTVIERLGDPLVHMIRNSIDHGIETPDKREAAGKPRMGTIRLSAVHSGTNVNVSIADDGGGFDVEAIRLQAVMRGLAEPDAQLTEQEILSFVFAPGFSTAKDVTSVSGRGVGMDVVRRGIEELGGKIELANGEGTGSTITLKLPLTLAIIEGLLVRVRAELFVLPLAAIKECVELAPLDMRRGNGGQLIDVRGDLVPYVRLRDLFRITGDPSPFEYAVITEVGGEQYGIAVDAILGDQQVVIKSLGKTYKDVQGISGGTVLGDGTVALIVDIPAVISAAQREREQLIKLEQQQGQIRNRSSIETQPKNFR